MTKSLLLGAALLVGMGASAQYNLTNAKAPKVGDFNLVQLDTIPQVSKGTAGANQYWDFQNFDLNTETVSTWNDAPTSTSGPDFPNAELEIDGAYYDLSTERMELVGFVINLTGTPQAVHYSNPETAIKFPSTYLTTFKDTSKYSTSFYLGMEAGGFTIDSVRISGNSKIDHNFDGWGTIVTPNGYFTQAIRERAYNITESKTEVCIVIAPGFPCQWADAGTLDPSFAGGIDTTIVYTWFNELSANPIASVTYDAADATPITASINADPSFTSIQTVNKTNSTVYPNPANGVVFIKGDAVTEVKITDLQGRVVLAEKNVKNNAVDVSALTAGNYMITFISATSVSTEQLSVIR